MTDNPPTPAPAASEVFISYASQDKPVADAVVGALEHAGLKCWIAPRDVDAGALYADAIVRAISGAKAFVLVLSANAIVSSHVGKELERASSKKRPIFALRIDAAPLTPGLEYFLSESQWIEVQAGNMEPAYAKLIGAIRKSAPIPQGVSPAQTPSAATSSVAPPKSRRNRILLAAGLAIVAVTFAALYAPKFWLAKHTPTQQSSTIAIPAVTISDKSIAVLPFTDMSEKHDQEYMSDGIAEELLNLLGQVSELKVIARTSSFSFKGKEFDIAEIAKRLNVAHVLEGSVRKSGNKIRITAQLIRTADSTHMWSETFDRPLKEIFAVQDEIAGAIVQALQIQLAGGELSRRKGGTQNLEAYQLYLRARNAQNLDTKASLDASSDYLEQAIKIDPSYGLAWSQLAWVVSLKTDNASLAPTEGFERARQLAQHALQLSPDLANAHARLQYIHLAFDWDWVAAEAEGHQALAIDPTNLQALLVSGLLSATLGRWDDSEQQLRAALVRDPLSSNVLGNLGVTYYLAGQFENSEAMYRKLLEVAPGFLWTRAYFAKTLLMQGKVDEALATVQQDVDERWRLVSLPIVLQAAGRKAEADEALKAQIAQWADTGAFYVAETYAYRGDHDRALEWLERAYRQRDVALVEITGEPLFKDMADDPRFKAFLRKMNLPE